LRMTEPIGFRNDRPRGRNAGASIIRSGPGGHWPRRHAENTAGQTLAAVVWFGALDASRGTPLRSPRGRDTPEDP